MVISGIADEAGKTVEEQIAAHKELGWNHIEMRTVSSGNFSRISDSDFDEVSKKLDEAGMHVTCFASEIANWARNIGGDFKIDVDDLRRAVQRMKKLNTKYIRVMSYPNDGRDEHLWREEVVKRLKELTRIAEEEGITLAHENCSGWGGVSAENCFELIEEIDSPAFGILFDTGNPVVEGQDSWDFYNRVKQYIVYVHIKDAKREDNSHVYTFPGDGDGYVQEIIADLKSSGYEGVLSIEPHLSAIIHEGKGVDDSSNASRVYVEYGKKLEKIVKSF